MLFIFNFLLCLNWNINPNLYSTTNGHNLFQLRKGILCFHQQFENIKPMDLYTNPLAVKVGNVFGLVWGLIDNQIVFLAVIRIFIIIFLTLYSFIIRFYILYGLPKTKTEINSIQPQHTEIIVFIIFLKIRDRIILYKRLFRYTLFTKFKLTKTLYRYPKEKYTDVIFPFLNRSLALF